MDFNAFNPGKQMFEYWEKHLGEYLEKMVRDPAFMRMISKNMSHNLDMEAMVQNHLQSVMKKLNLPDRDSLTQTQAMLHELENKVLDMEEVLPQLMQEQLILLQDSIQRILAASLTPQADPVKAKEPVKAKPAKVSKSAKSETPVKTKTKKEISKTDTKNATPIKKADSVKPKTSPRGKKA